MDNKQLSNKRNKEKETVKLMIRIYCNGNHGTSKDMLCDDCRSLAEYATTRVEHCPYMETKTFCSNCRTHCYKPEMREKIRTVMRWSGPRMIFHNPVMAIQHVIEMKKERKHLSCK